MIVPPVFAIPAQDKARVCLPYPAGETAALWRTASVIAASRHFGAPIPRRSAHSRQLPAEALQLPSPFVVSFVSVPCNRCYIFGWCCQASFRKRCGFLAASPVVPANGTIKGTHYGPLWDVCHNCGAENGRKWHTCECHHRRWLSGCSFPLLQGQGSVGGRAPFEPASISPATMAEEGTDLCVGPPPGAPLPQEYRSRSPRAHQPCREKWNMAMLGNGPSLPPLGRRQGPSGGGKQ
jgi:hypothetical protein